MRIGHLSAQRKSVVSKGLLRCVALLSALCLAFPATTSLAAGFPGVGRTISGLGYYNLDTGYDSKFRLYGTVDGFADYYDSGNHSGTRFEGGGAWTNKIGAYWRQAIAEDTVVEALLEEGFNLNGTALDQHWRQIGALRYAVITLRSKQWGKVEYGKTANVSAPTYADSFYAALGSPYTFLTITPSGPGWYVLDSRPKHSLVYTTPNLNGFSVATAMSFGFDRAASIHEGKTLRGKGMRLQYNSSTLIAVVSYNDYLNNPWHNGTDFVQTHNIYKSASVFYDFGPVSSNITWQQQAVRLAGTPTVDNWTWGLMLPVGQRHLARVSVTHRQVDTARADATGIQIGYDHFLKPNLALYTRLSMISNQTASQVSYATLPADTGEDVSSLMVGMYWHFGGGR